MRTPFQILVVAISAIALGVLPSQRPTPAAAYDVGNALTTVYSGHNDYRFENFDFHQVNSACSSSVVSSSNVDNPINLVWYQNASTAYVQNFLNNAGYTGTGETDCAGVQQWSYPYTQYYPASAGLKTPPGCNTTNPYMDKHVRYYGTYYDQSWGYFVIGGAHKDFNDTTCSSGKTFGYQEDAEHGVANDLAIYSNDCNVYPLDLTTECINATYRDSQNMSNQQEYVQGHGETQCGAYQPYGFWIDSTHCMQSDGYATTFQVQ
jgi:hypothetical protein